MSKRVLVTGPFGQIGSELVPELQDKHGKENVVALGHNYIPDDYEGVLEQGDVKDKEFLESLWEKYDFDVVYHLASLLSATGEKRPDLAWSVNMDGLKNILDLARENDNKVFWASSIAVFGPNTPMDDTPQHTILEPVTMYGVTKVSGELLCQYYNEKFGLDVRGLRYPGLLSWKEKPGGGTTDYAVEMFYKAIQGEKYTCFVREDTQLPMMYMEDAIEGTLQLMEADEEDITIRTSYNHSAISFRADKLVEEIQRYYPDFEVEYEPDERQKNADSWPNSVDDSKAREDWGWDHKYDLEKMAEVMIENLEEKLN
ncbi:MAG: NAD-dependent epimerase/dehydratase family protein [Candidatus Thermoplasmatota archaeon]|nr:NAD-dependent epimerase/dehydratase family protein [Candidatus Thermoplasmatota archaeon]